MEKQDIKQDEITRRARTDEPVVGTEGESKKFVWLAIGSIVLTIVSWICAGFNAWLAIGLSAAAVVVGAMALKSHRHSVRNTAITSIIAATVLLVVVAAFLIVIYVGLKSV